MNPIVGQAIEAAREAEAARLAAREPGSQGESDDDGDEFGPANGPQLDSGPIHRVEIEAAEMVPSHSGRAQRGFVARVHREVLIHPGSAGRQGDKPSGAAATRPETHVFSDHHDLVGFLRNEFAKDCAGK